MSVALTVLQILITMLFLPLQIGAKGHASLARDRVELDLTLFRLPVARVRIKRENGIFNVYVNGNETEMKGKFKLGRAVNVIKQCKVEGLRIRGDLLALVGAEDAKNTALMCAAVQCALRPIFGEMSVYAARPTDVLELDGNVKVRITVLQLGALLAAGLGF